MKTTTTLSEDTKKILSEIKAEIETAAKIEYHKRFLEETGFKVGDIVLCYFPTQSGTSKQSYHTSSDSNGIIKQYPNGVLYVESCEKLSTSRNVSNGRSGRSYKSWWEYERVHIKQDISSIL